MIPTKEGDMLVQDEQQLAGFALNQKSAQSFPVDTVLDFTVPCRTFVKKSKNGNAFLYIYDALKNSTESRIPIGMLIRCPFLATNCEPLKNQTTLQDQLLACSADPNPGLAAWRLVKNRKIKVLKNVVCKDTPFGSQTEADIPFNVFEWANN